MSLMQWRPRSESFTNSGISAATEYHVAFLRHLCLTVICIAWSSACHS